MEAVGNISRLLRLLQIRCGVPLICQKLMDCIAQHEQRIQFCPIRVLVQGCALFYDVPHNANVWRSQLVTVVGFFGPPSQLCREVWLNNETDTGAIVGVT